MTLLLTEDEAFDQVRATPGGDDADDVMRKAEEASEIVLDYVTAEDKGDWTAEDCPLLIKAAVKLVLTRLYDMRDDTPLTPQIKSLLRRWRDPALA